MPRRKKGKTGKSSPSQGTSQGSSQGTSQGSSQGISQGLSQGTSQGPSQGTPTTTSVRLGLQCRVQQDRCTVVWCNNVQSAFVCNGRIKDKTLNGGSMFLITRVNTLISNPQPEQINVTASSPQLSTG
jgi:hypothetical protein